MTCVSLMAIAASTAFAELDPVEQLFLDAPAAAPLANGSGPSIADQEPVSSLFTAEEEMPHVAAAGSRDQESPDMSQDALWTADGADHSVSAQIGSMAASNPTAKPAATPVNAVPEPSAILLALAALIYFLLFGRRRRVA
jgi:hypothetical protein